MEESQVQLALDLAQQAHEGQRDKLGRPFITHCLRVADGLEGPARAVALLHDVLEKAPGWDAGRLRQAGVAPEVLDGVLAMTRQEGEAYDAFVRRAAAHPLARPVKVADLRDNLTQARQGGRDGTRYRDALRQLGAVGADRSG